MNEPPAAHLMPAETGAHRFCGERLHYAGFWIRVGARAGDVFALFIPLVLIIVLSTLSRPIALALVLPNALMFWLYALCFHATTGQTLGKRAFGLRVVRPDGSRVGWTDSFWRGAVDLLFALVWGAARLWGLNALTPAEYAGSVWLQRQQLMRHSLPPFFAWVDTAASLWVIAEIIIMLANRERRTLHDFIGGTVVISEGHPEYE